MLGILPEYCLAVENAPLGIQSAKAAGMYTVAITTTLTAEYLKGADGIISNLSDILHHNTYILQACNKRE